MWSNIKFKSLTTLSLSSNYIACASEWSNIKFKSLTALSLCSNYIACASELRTNTQSVSLTTATGFKAKAFSTFSRFILEIYLTRCLFYFHTILVLKLFKTHLGQLKVN